MADNYSSLKKDELVKLLEQKDAELATYQEIEEAQNSKINDLQNQLETVSQPGKVSQQLERTYEPYDRELLIACVGALKDAQSHGPMDEQNFAACAPVFADQAITLYQLTKERFDSLDNLPCPENDSGMSNEELAS